MVNKKSGSLQSVSEILKKFNPTKDKYISREFQKYGYYLAEQLGELRHVSLYIKLAKEHPRGVLEEALSFVKDANARSKGRLFMWKLKELGAFGAKVPSSKYKAPFIG